MKAIRLTQEIITLNSHLFRGRAVGDVVTFSTLPSKFIEQIPNVDAIDEDDEQFILLTHYAYAKRTDLHQQHGFKDVLRPDFNEEVEKLGNIIDSPELDFFTYEVKALTDVEKDALIPLELSSLNFKIGLFKEFNIKPDDVQNVINAISDATIRYEIDILWNSADFFERTNAYLLGFLDQFGITVEQLNQLFKDYGNV